MNDWLINGWIDWYGRGCVIILAMIAFEEGAHAQSIQEESTPPIRPPAMESISPQALVGNGVDQELANGGSQLDAQRLDTQSPTLILDKIVKSEIETFRDVDRLNDRVQRLLAIQEKRNREKQRPATAIPEKAPDVIAELDPNENQSSPGSIPVSTETNPSQDVVATPAVLQSGTKLLAGPPDPMALADSLYRSGEWMIAKDTYISAEQMGGAETNLLWIRYQIATCHRKIGEHDDAKRIYLEIANTAPTSELFEPSKNEVVIAAKWWLDHQEAMNQIAAKANIEIMNDIITQNK